MRFLSLCRKTLIENARDWKVLILILSLAPFFVVIMYYYFHETKFTLRVTVINRDAGMAPGTPASLNAGEAVLAELERTAYPDGTKALVVRRESDHDAALRGLKDRTADVVVEIPPEFTKTLLEYAQGRQPPPALVKTYGDPTNTRYMMAGAWGDAVVFQYAATLSGMKGPIDLQAETITPGRRIGEFELYMPALLALALMGLLFTAAGSFIREKDKGTIVRLRMSSITTFEWIASVSLVQVAIGLLAMGSTLLTAVALGYRATASLPALTVIGILSTLAIVAISVIVAAVLRTIFDLMTVGCFPYFLLMFFSGGMFPLPDLPLLTLGGRTLNANDILPTTHTVAALGRVLNHGAGLRDIAFELAAIALLTTLAFAAGTWLFARRHMRAR